MELVIPSRLAYVETVLEMGPLFEVLPFIPPAANADSNTLPQISYMTLRIRNQ